MSTALAAGIVHHNWATFFWLHRCTGSCLRWQPRPRSGSSPCSQWSAPGWSTASPLPGSTRFSFSPHKIYHIFHYWPLVAVIRKKKRDSLLVRWGFRLQLTRTKIKTIVLLVWSASVLISIPPLAGVNRFVYEVVRYFPLSHQRQKEPSICCLLVVCITFIKPS